MKRPVGEVFLQWTAGLCAVVLCMALAACGQPEAASSTVWIEPVSLPEVSSSQPEPEPEPEGGALPLDTGMNALTGQPRPEGMLDGQRPVAVMVNGAERALPQRGLAAADVLVEMPDEKGNTQIMAMYANFNTVPQVGPVCSMQDSFVQMALPAGAILAYADKTPYANNLLAVAGYKSIDGIQLAKTAFWFDVARTTPRPGGKMHEHSWFTDGGLMLAGMGAIDIITVGEVHTLFRFAEEAAPVKTEAEVVNGALASRALLGFTFNKESGLYDKWVYGREHTDEDGARLSFTNVFFLVSETGEKPDSSLIEFDMSGGKGWYFTAGSVQEITWEKGTADAPLRLYAADGKELRVQKGKSYIGFAPAVLENPVTWAAAEPVQEPPPEATPPESTPPASETPASEVPAEGQMG